MAWKRTEPESPKTPSYAPRHEGPTGSGARRERAVVGASIQIEGDLSGEEDLTILGRVQGTVDVKGNSVTIGESGRVKADVYGQTIIVEGQVEGNLYGGDQIVLRSSGNVRGNLTAPRVALDDGAQFKGSIDMEPKRQAGGARSGATSSTRAEDRSGGSGGSGSGKGSGESAPKSGGETGEASAEGSGEAPGRVNAAGAKAGG